MAEIQPSQVFSPSSNVPTEVVESQVPVSATRNLSSQTTIPGPATTAKTETDQQLVTAKAPQSPLKVTARSFVPLQTHMVNTIPVQSFTNDPGRYPVQPGCRLPSPLRYLTQAQKADWWRHMEARLHSTEQTMYHLSVAAQTAFSPIEVIGILKGAIESNLVGRAIWADIIFATDHCSPEDNTDGRGRFRYYQYAKTNLEMLEASDRVYRESLRINENQAFLPTQTRDQGRLSTIHSATSSTLSRASQHRNHVSEAFSSSMSSTNPFPTASFAGGSNTFERWANPPPQPEIRLTKPRNQEGKLWEPTTRSPRRNKSSVTREATIREGTWSKGKENANRLAMSPNDIHAMSADRSMQPQTQGRPAARRVSPHNRPFHHAGMMNYAGALKKNTQVTRSNKPATADKPSGRGRAGEKVGSRGRAKGKGKEKAVDVTSDPVVKKGPPVKVSVWPSVILVDAERALASGSVAVAPNTLGTETIHSCAVNVVAGKVELSSPSKHDKVLKTNPYEVKDVWKDQSEAELLAENVKSSEMSVVSSAKHTDWVTAIVASEEPDPSVSASHNTVASDAQSNTVAKKFAKLGRSERKKARSNASASTQSSGAGGSTSVPQPDSGTSQPDEHNLDSSLKAVAQHGTIKQLYSAKRAQGRSPNRSSKKLHQQTMGAEAGGGNQIKRSYEQMGIVQNKNTKTSTRTYVAPRVPPHCAPDRSAYPGMRYPAVSPERLARARLASQGALTNSMFYERPNRHSPVYGPVLLGSQVTTQQPAEVSQAQNVWLPRRSDRIYMPAEHFDGEGMTHRNIQHNYGESSSGRHSPQRTPRGRPQELYDETLQQPRDTSAQELYSTPHVARYNLNKDGERIELEAHTKLPEATSQPFFAPPLKDTNQNQRTSQKVLLHIRTSSVASKTQSPTSKRDTSFLQLSKGKSEQPEQARHHAMFDGRSHKRRGSLYAPIPLFPSRQPIKHVSHASCGDLPQDTGPPSIGSLYPTPSMLDQKQDFKRYVHRGNGELLRGFNTKSNSSHNMSSDTSYNAQGQRRSKLHRNRHIDEQDKKTMSEFRFPATSVQHMQDLEDERGANSSSHPSPFQISADIKATQSSADLSERQTTEELNRSRSSSIRSEKFQAVRESSQRMRAITDAAEKTAQRSRGASVLSSTHHSESSSPVVLAQQICEISSSQHKEKHNKTPWAQEAKRSSLLQLPSATLQVDAENFPDLGSHTSQPGATIRKRPQKNRKAMANETEQGERSTLPTCESTHQASTQPSPENINPQVSSDDLTTCGPEKKTTGSEKTDNDSPAPTPTQTIPLPGLSTEELHQSPIKKNRRKKRASRVKAKPIRVSNGAPELMATLGNFHSATHGRRDLEDQVRK